MENQVLRKKHWDLIYCPKQSSPGFHFAVVAFKVFSKRTLFQSHPGSCTQIHNDERLSCYITELQELQKSKLDFVAPNTPDGQRGRSFQCRS